jgi:hypothetical protein
MASLLSTFNQKNKLFSRPIAITIHSPNSNPFVDIDDIELLDSLDNNLLSNGNFSHGKDYWFFSADNHTLWHSFNFFVGFYHDFGAVGLVLLIALSVLSFSRLIKLVRMREPLSVILLVSIVGFFGIAMIDNPFDAPQISLLFYLLLFSSFVIWQHKNKQ